MKRHWLERQDGFAGFVHRPNLFLESARGTDRPQLAGGVNQYRYGVHISRCHPANAGDKAAVIHIRANRADTSDVTRRSNISAGIIAQTDIAAADGVHERSTPDGCVAAPRGVAEERPITVSCVEIGCGVAKERLNTGRRVALPAAVAEECEGSIGRVGETKSVA